MNGNRRTLPLGLVLALLVVLSGCGGRPVVSPTPTATAPANACTPFPAPSLEDAPTVQGPNAFGQMLRLVCDFSGGPARERPRVPGTPGHAAAAAELRGALLATGWRTQALNFTGHDFEAIMADHEKPSSVRFFYDSPSYCSAEARTRMRDLNFTNLEGRWGPEGGPIFLLMAHWESKRAATQDSDHPDQPVLGANDGASGVGVLLEVARALARSSATWELRILFTDGEDGFEDCHPLAGSTVYADRMTAEERQRTRHVLLLDMVGDSNATFNRGCGSDAALADALWAAAQRLGASQFRTTGACSVLDDHSPFEERGLKAVDVIDMRDGSFPPYWHTVHDTPDQLSADAMGAVAQVVYEVVKAPPEG